MPPLLIRVRTPSRTLRVTLDSASTVAALRKEIAKESGATAPFRISKNPTVRLPPSPVVARARTTPTRD